MSEAQQTSFTDTYTRKVTGETFQYLARYTGGDHPTWSAQVFHDGVLKGELGGDLVNNQTHGAEVQQSVVDLVESTIEAGIGIAE